MASVVRPEDLSAAVVARINAGDLDGLLDLYEEIAALERPDGTLAIGRAQLRQFYARLLETKPQSEPGVVLPALVQGDLALTTTQIGSSASLEIARRQSDGAGAGSSSIDRTCYVPGLTVEPWARGACR